LKDKSPVDYLKEFTKQHRDSYIDELNGGLEAIFKKIHCRTLFLPATELKQLQDLSSLNPRQLTGGDKCPIVTTFFNTILNRISRWS
jgi:hypothetical protein